jgi:hypothetical protein
MKILKKILLGLAVIIVLALIIAAFLPSKMKVERSIEINKPLNEVFAKVGDFNQWNQWSPWLEMEPSAKTTVKGTPGTPGEVLEWKGDKIGAGSMTIDSTSENKAIFYTTRFTAPWESQASGYWKFELAGNGTKITWGFEGDAPWPMMRIMAPLLIVPGLNKDFQRGLDKLKAECEKK